MPNIKTAAASQQHESSDHHKAHRHVAFITCKIVWSTLRGEVMLPNMALSLSVWSSPASTAAASAAAPRGDDSAAFASASTARACAAGSAGCETQQSSHVLMELSLLLYMHYGMVVALLSDSWALYMLCVNVTCHKPGKLVSQDSYAAWSCALLLACSGPHLSGVLSEAHRSAPHSALAQCLRCCSARSG